MSDEWIGIVKAAAPKYLKKVADLTMRMRLWLKMLERRGLVTLNYTGSHESIFTLDYKEPPIESYGDAGTINYQRRDYLKQGTIDWRGYIGTDLMTLKEKEMLKGGDHVIVNRYARIFPKLDKGLRNTLGTEIYIDGNAPGNENRYCGLDTFTGAGACAVTDLVAQPNSSYFGISTELHQSGRWSQGLGDGNYPNATIGYDWPEGEGSSDFDYNSPKLVNWSSNAWGTGSTAWEDNCERVLRRTIQWLTMTSGSEMPALMCMMAGHMLSGVKNHFEARHRILAPHKEAEELGFSDVLNFEGCGLKAEFGCPANTGYVMDISQMELAILCDELIKHKGPDWDTTSASWRFLVYTFGNFIFKPKFTAKLFNYASAA